MSLSAAPPRSANERLRADIEDWLLHRGAPHFIEDYRVTTDVLTRSFPVMVILWALGIIAEVGFAKTFRVLGLFLAIGAVLATWVASNLLRKRRPFSLPDSVGAAEVAFFVLSPAIVSVVLDRDVSRAIMSALIGAVLIGAAFQITSYAIVPLTRYILQRLGVQLRLLGNLSSRAIPLLLLITVTIFLTAETWQMSSRLVGASQVATIALFVLAGGIFLFSRVPGEVASVEQFNSWAEVAEVVVNTPAHHVVLPTVGDPTEPAASRRQRINLMVMALTTQTVQITLVAGVVYAFFILLGVVAIPPATVEAFVGEPPHVLMSVGLGSSTFAISSELLRVAGFLAAFSGMAFAVYLVTDSTYRAEFASDVSTELREVLAVRIAYLQLLSQHDVARSGQPAQPSQSPTGGQTPTAQSDRSRAARTVRRGRGKRKRP